MVEDGKKTKGNVMQKKSAERNGNCKKRKNFENKMREARTLCKEEENELVKHRPKRSHINFNLAETCLARREKARARVMQISTIEIVILIR